MNDLRSKNLLKVIIINVMKRLFEKIEKEYINLTPVYS